MSQIWRKIFTANSYIPPAKERQDSLKPDFVEHFPFSVALRGLTLPQAKENFQYQLRACFYDAKFSLFFGHPWRSRWVSPKRGEAKLVFNETIFFHTLFKDASVVLLVEIACKDRQGQMDEDALEGWTLLGLTNQDIGDFSDNGNKRTSQCSLYIGSPKLVMFVREPVEQCSKLLKSHGILHYTLHSHRLLVRGYDFVPENTIFGSNDLIPGLDQPERGSPLLNPVPRAPAAAFLDSLSLQLGSQAERIEAELCILSNKERLFKDNRLPHNGEEMMVLERRIRIGIHNGWSFIQEPTTFHLSTESSSGTHSLRKKGTSAKIHSRTQSWNPRQHGNKPMLLKNRVDLDFLVADPGLAVVFILDFLVGLQTPQPNPPSQSVVVCWGAWSPFAQKTQIPANVRVAMAGGPATNPDQVLSFKNQLELSPAADQQGRKPAPVPTAVLNFQFCLKSEADLAAPSGSSTLVVPQPVAPRRKTTPTAPPPLPVQSPPKTPESPQDEDLDEDPEERRRHLRPKPPSRMGRPPLTQQAYEPPSSVGVQPALPLPQPPVVPGGGYQWGFQQGTPTPHHPPSMAYYGRMTELPTPGPAQVPVFAIQQKSIGVSAISRKTFGVLAAAKFPPLSDRHGDSPLLVDYSDPRTAGPKLEQELADPLGSNEVIIQFMALASPSSSQTPDLPSNVFFTFNFYRFPQVNTQRLLLSLPKNVPDYVPGCPMILKRMDKTGSTTPGDPGYQVKFTVDPEYLKPGEQRIFIQYMMRNALHVDVWDGDSLMLLGSCLLPLRHLCRKSQEAVQSYCQLPLVTTELKSSDSGENQGINAVMRAVLYVRVANIGYPFMGESALGDLGRMSRNPAIISHSLGRSSGFSNQRMVRGQPLRISQNRSQFTIGQKLEIQSADVSEEKRRKLSRLENLRQIERSITSPSMRRSVVENLTRDLQTFRIVRQENKHETLMTAVLQSITTVHTIFPSLGSTEFMEYLLENPTSEAIAVYMDNSDPDLRLITDPREWQFFKRVHSLKTPLDDSVFDLSSTTTVSTNEPSGKPVQLFLKPRESLYIPLKYQTFHALEQPYGSETLHGAVHKTHSRTLMMESKTINVTFKQADNNELISILVLQVEPQPPVIHQLFRFYHPENSFLVKYLRLNMLQGDKGFHSVTTTDDNVICELRYEAQGGPQDVFMKVSCGSSPQVKCFNLLLFADPYQAFPIQIWQINIHAATKIDINTVQGHTSKFSLVLKAGPGIRMIRCFSSAPNELKCSPAEPFVLQPSGPMELQVTFKPLATGERTLQLTAVDIEMEELVHSWLICARVMSPEIGKAYQVQIPVPTDQIINKKIAYKNEYNVERRFSLATNREDLVSFKEESIKLGGKASGALSLRFHPRTQPMTAEILIFVNDEDGNNQETVSVKAVYSKL